MFGRGGDVLGGIGKGVCVCRAANDCDGMVEFDNFGSFV